MIEPTPNHRYQRIRIEPGDILWCWCSRCMGRTDHVWDGHKLWCTICHPKKKPVEDTPTPPVVEPVGK